MLFQQNYAIPREVARCNCLPTSQPLSKNFVILSYRLGALSIVTVLPLVFLLPSTPLRTTTSVPLPVEFPSVTNAFLAQVLVDELLVYSRVWSVRGSCTRRRPSTR